MARSFDIQDLVHQVGELSRQRLAMQLIGPAVSVSRFMPPQAAGEGDMAFLTNAAYADAMKASAASVLILREQDAGRSLAKRCPHARWCFVKIRMPFLPLPRSC